MPVLWSSEAGRVPNLQRGSGVVHRFSASHRTGTLPGLGLGRFRWRVGRSRRLRRPSAIASSSRNRRVRRASRFGGLGGRSRGSRRGHRAAGGRRKGALDGRRRRTGVASATSNPGCSSERCGPKVRSDQPRHRKSAAHFLESRELIEADQSFCRPGVDSGDGVNTTDTFIKVARVPSARAGGW